MSSVRAAGVGVAASVIILLVLSAVVGVDPGQVERLGLQPFILAVLFAIARLLLQAVRFHVLVHALGAGHAVSFSRTLLVRMGSEFVALATPTYVGGEVIRILWLRRRGVETGRALWIGFADLFVDVMVGVSAALAAAGLAAQVGAYPLAAAIAGVALPIAGIYATLFGLSIRGRASVPALVQRLALRFLGRERGGRRIDQINRMLRQYTEVARLPFGNHWTLTLPLVLLLSIGLPLTAGASLWAIFVAAEIPLDALTSAVIAYGTYAFGAIPITPGGSGLTEAAAYVFAVEFSGRSSWAAVIAWRIATYHVPLLLTGAFLLLTLRTELRGVRRFVVEEHQRRPPAS